MFQNIIKQRKNEWLKSTPALLTGLVDYIRKRGFMREPQIEAIEIYLYLKIVGKNKPLWQLISEGFFNKNEDLSHLMISQNIRTLLQENPAARALFEMRADFPELEKIIINNFKFIDYVQFIKKIFYQVEYTDYLFSLPMGAGKTFLMAAFIYIDLYFAINEPTNFVFAHNFIVLAPSGLKSSIIPSLKSIEQFDPTWVLPNPAASNIKKMLHFEVLDKPKSAAKSNRVKNPNAQKIANLQPFDDLMGAVFVVNAEKVILDKVEEGKDPTFFDKTEDEKDKYANEIRYLIGKIPQIAILIDEVHHAATDEIKLRQVVNSWYSKGSITTVLGFSGTPYLPKPEKIELTATHHLKISQISNVVYHYPLLSAVETFLKKPKVIVEKGKNINPLDIIKTGVEAFLKDFGDTIYADGTSAKLAIYCSSIEKLEEDVFPFLVGQMGISPAHILKYHQGNKNYKIPKENQTAFLHLDTVASRKKIILLVQIGKEGWDCRSLTGVILSQKGDCPTNMVLQTACRCLRQVHYPASLPIPQKTAIICLNEDNEKSLDKQLSEEQHTNLSALAAVKEKTENSNSRPRYDRRAIPLKLPHIAFCQLKIHFDHYQLEQEPYTAHKLTLLNSIEHKALQIEERELQNGSNKQRHFIDHEKGEPAHFDYWLLQIAKESFNSLSFHTLKHFSHLLLPVFNKITFKYPDNQQLVFNERFPLAKINALVRKAFHCRIDVKTKEEIIEKEAELLIIANLKAIADSKNLLPSADETNSIISCDKSGLSVEQVYEGINDSLEKMRQNLIAQGMGDMLQNIPTKTTSLFEKNKDKTFHYIPYRLDSGFEKIFLENVLQDADFQKLGLEAYFNGDDNLSDFWIDCYQRLHNNHWRRIGHYYPDFLLLQRNPQSQQVHKVLIVETKGEGFARNFAEKKSFMLSEFIPRNNQWFGYQRFQFLYIQDDTEESLLRQQINQTLKSFFG